MEPFNASNNNNPTDNLITDPGTDSVTTQPIGGQPKADNETVTIDTRQMQQELERRQQELEAKAAELAAREEALRQSTVGPNGEFRRQHNWPPMPAFIPVQPCFFQDINVDIKPEFQRTVQQAYHLWIAFALIQILNILGSILLLSYGFHEAGSMLSFGILTAIFFVPLTYVSWFRPLYKAFRDDSSFNFMIFFFVFFLQSLVVALWSLGLPAAGPCGFFVALKSMGISAILTLVMLLVTGSWMAYTIASGLFILRVLSIYRSSEASLVKARQEFTRDFLSSSLAPMGTTTGTSAVSH